MLSEEEIDNLTGIFYSEAPYDYVIEFDNRKRKYYKGVCSYDEKICVIYGPDTYYEALETVLHEIAHARIQHQTHSDVWEKEFVRLLQRYKFPRELAGRAGRATIIGPNVKAYINGTV